MTAASEENDYEARLLVVDDEPNIRDLLATSLRFAGRHCKSPHAPL